MSSSRIVGPFVTVSGMALAGLAGARPPAYTIAAGFTTQLHNVAADKLHEECFDEECKEHGGVVVAEGKTEHAEAPVELKIREYRDRKGLGAKELEALAHKSQVRAGAGRELRLVAGTVSNKPVVEQWTVEDACEPEIIGRLMIALPDKVVEIEAIGSAARADVAGDAFSQIDKILHGLRIRRLGESTVDPAPAVPDETVQAIVKGC